MKKLKTLGFVIALTLGATAGLQAAVMVCDKDKCNCDGTTCYCPADACVPKED